MSAESAWPEPSTVYRLLPRIVYPWKTTLAELRAGCGKCTSGFEKSPAAALARPIETPCPACATCIEPSSSPLKLTC